MKLQNFLFASAILATATALAACADVDDSDGEDVGVAMQGVGGTLNNNISPQALAAASASLGVFDTYGITSSPSVLDPLQLCQSPHPAGSCTLRNPWQSWLQDGAASPAGKDAVSHQWMLKGIAKCALESGFTLYSQDGQSFPGMVGLAPNWKDNRLVGDDNRERISGCIIALLNGNNVSVSLCMIGSASPDNAPCDDAAYTQREAGFFGNLFTARPTAYVAGPQADQMVNTGRMCTSNQGNYCCLESDTLSTCGNGNKIVLVPGILNRCNDVTLPYSGPNQYCTSFFSTKEPGRAYNHGFTTFVSAN